jgi:very-short-patch-repair endonuclease
VTALVAAGDFLIHHRQPLATIEALAAGAARFPRHRGHRRLATALALLDERSESPRESHLRVILHQAQIATVANFPIRTTGGFDYRVDLAIPRRMIVIEYQSDEFHGDPAARRHDMTRRARLEADGWFVMELNADDLANPGELVPRVRQVITRRPLLA